MPEYYPVNEPEERDSTTAAEWLEQDNLLKMDEREAAEEMLEEWDRSHRYVRDLEAQWKVNLAVTAGYLDAQLVKIQDQQKAQIPLGSSPDLGGLNKAARLRQRLTATLFADPPVPEATPSSDEDEDVDAAETATRVLQDVTSEGSLDYSVRSAAAFDVAGDFGSGFHHLWTDPTGGGMKKVEILAHPMATDKTDALMEEAVLSGQVADMPYVTKYVKTDGTLTSDPFEEDIDRRWMPSIKVDTLTGRHIRMMPYGSDIWDAESVLIGAMIPLGTIRSLFPEKLKDMEDDELEELISTRPKNARDLVPHAMRNVYEKGSDENQLVFVLTKYHKQCQYYPKGAYLIAAGKNTMLYRGEWYDEEHDEAMDIPVTQFLQYRRNGNPYGEGVMQNLGPGNKIRGLMLSSMLEHLDRFRDRKTFVPMVSNIQPEQLQSETRTVIPYNSAGGAPIVNEEVPDFPVMVEKMFQGITADMDDASGLQETAQGLAPSSVKSGKHAERIIQQVNVGLSDLRENTERALVRGYRIILQLIRRDFTTEQRLRWVGEDGQYKEQRWSSSDFRTARDVRIQRGSFTLLSPAAKADIARQLYADQAIPPDAYQRIIAKSIGGMIALQDDPHRMRVRRQIWEWEQGPPDGWQPPQPQVNPQTGQEVTPPDPVSMSIFQPLPCDFHPQVAMVREYELGRALAGTRFWRYPQPWQQAAIQAYEQARQAAGIMTTQEVRQVQAQQAQAQQAAAQQDAEAKRAVVDQKVRADQQKMQVDMQKEQLRAQTEIEKARLQRQSNELDVMASV